MAEEIKTEVETPAAAPAPKVEAPKAAPKPPAPTPAVKPEPVAEVEVEASHPDFPTGDEILRRMQGAPPQ